MIPVIPTLTVRPIESADSGAAIALLNRWMARSAYTLPFDMESYRSQVVQEPPPTHFEVRWSAHLRLGAWRAGDLLGYADLATGHDREHLDDAVGEPQGILRFVAITEHAGLAAPVFAELMQHAQEWWRQKSATSASAFHISTGYPAFQVGAGVLPGDWSLLIRLLTEGDWRFSQRYYALVRATGAIHEEEVPQADLSLVQHRLHDGRIYRVYFRRVEPVAHARVAGMTLDRPGTAERVAHLVDLWVAEPWRNRNLGKWLLRRVLNDVTLQGYQETIAFLPMTLPIALNLLVQHGFLEINYRGYTLEKSLPP